MFDDYCHECEHRRLVFPSQITALVNTDHGIEVSYTCWCGAEQVWRTGALAAA